MSNDAASCPKANGPPFLGDHSNTNFSALPAGSLRGANFEHAILRGAIFVGQDLTGASFHKADLGPSANGVVDFSNANLTTTCFIGARLEATDFTFAAMTCTDFSGTSLLKAQFGPQQTINPGQDCRTLFVGSTLAVDAIALSNWGKADFTDAMFTGVSPATFSLAGQDITGAMLGCTTFTTPPAPGCKAFSAIDFTGANLTGVDLTGAVLVKAVLNRAALNGAVLSRADLSYATLTCARFYGLASNSACTPKPPNSVTPNQGAKLIQATMPYADFSFATVDYAVLTGANLSGGVFTGTSLQQASLEANNGVGAATVLGATFTGTNFSNAQIDLVQFNNVILTDSKFTNASTLKGTTFTGSIMPGADFTGATLEGVAFDAAILENAVFANAKMPSVGSGVTFSCAQLGGATFANATVPAASFAAAIMPPGPPGTTPPAPCCKQANGPAWCGTNNATQQAYGPVTYPVLATRTNCPNGEMAVCTGTQWILPQWQTNLCSRDRTTQTMWAPPDCGGAPGENVVFKDLNLKQCILNSLPGKPAEVAVTTAATLLSVSCPNRGIADLTGLEQFTNLTSLDLSANQLTQFALALPQLQSLKLSDNRLTSLDMKGLNSSSPVRLEAANNSLSAVIGLESINLVVVDLSYNQLTSFDLPAQAPSLTYADLSNNKLTNVLNSSSQNLDAMTPLAYLDLSGNSIPTVGSVAAIAGSSSPTLLSLFLACNPTFQCSSLGLTGGASPAQALMRSSCADYNPQNQSWIVLTNPQCPIGGRQRTVRAPSGRTP
ncbi:MAG: pentapeptide repeat-containing protein [Gemmatimonadaceae bacterium]|nr:pentapeptide repeat-containing protein [Acetobacteraceae bacterium]